MSNWVRFKAHSTECTAEVNSLPLGEKNSAELFQNLKCAKQYAGKKRKPPTQGAFLTLHAVFAYYIMACV